MGRMNGLVLSLGALGFGILYLPIIIMVIFSFNAGKLVSVCGKVLVLKPVSLFCALLGTVADATSSSGATSGAAG